MFTRDVYKDEKAPAYALLFVTMRKYGVECFEWEPELLRVEINRDYDIRLSDLQHDKLHAAIVVYTTNQFETDWRVFETCCQLFNNELVDHEDLNPLEAEEIIIGIVEASLIKKDDEDGLEYDDEVRAYAGLVFHNYGMHKAPRLFPAALMPKSAPAEDKEKNLALKELFDTHFNYILEYLEKID